MFVGLFPLQNLQKIIQLSEVARPQPVSFSLRSQLRNLPLKRSSGSSNVWQVVLSCCNNMFWTSIFSNVFYKSLSVSLFCIELHSQHYELHFGKSKDLIMPSDQKSRYTYTFSFVIKDILKKRYFLAFSRDPINKHSY